MRAVVLLLQLWSLVQTTLAFAKGPRLYMCETFRVEHDNSVSETGEDVKIILRKVTSPGNDSEEVSCYVPSQEYTVELKRFGIRTTLGGFLLQADRGRFPFNTRTWPFAETSSGRPLVVSGPCTRSVSHKELLIYENPTPILKFGYKSPKGSQPLKFRLSVVFDREHHLENVNISIPSCLHTPPPPPDTTAAVTTEMNVTTPTPDMNVTSPTPDMNGTTPTPDMNGTTPTPGMNTTACNNATIATTTTPTTMPQTPADGQCVYGKNITHENKTMTTVKDNVTYTCVSYEDIRTVACGEECTTNDGAPVCCESSSLTLRRKKFKCTACSDIPTGNEHPQEMDMILDVYVPSSRCSCYLCPTSDNPA